MSQMPYYPRGGGGLPNSTNYNQSRDVEYSTQGGYYTSNGSRGIAGYQEPVQRGPPAQVNRSQEVAISTPYRQLVTNQYVKVSIEARGWVIGIIIGVIKALDAVTHWGYSVRYQLGEKTLEGDFPAKDVIPLNSKT